MCEGDCLFEGLGLFFGQSLNLQSLPGPVIRIERNRKCEALEADQGLVVHDGVQLPDAAACGVHVPLAGAMGVQIDGAEPSLTVGP